MLRLLSPASVIVLVILGCARRAIQQSQRFFRQLCMAVKIPRLAEISSTTFASQLEVARRVSNENPHLYYEIQASNDFGHLALDALQAATAALRDCVSRRDEAAFVEMMRAGQEALRVVIASPAAGSGD